MKQAYERQSYRLCERLEIHWHRNRAQPFEKQNSSRYQMTASES